MNRRNFLVALAVALPLTFFGSAQGETQFRPIAIASIPGADAVNDASKRYVIVGINTGYFILFDLQTGARRSLDENEWIVPDGDWLWNLKLQRHVKLLLREANGPTRSYALPSSVVASSIDLVLTPWTRVEPNRDRVELILNGHYYRWKLGSRRLERDVVLEPNRALNQATTRDGKTVVSAKPGAITLFSTGSPRTSKRVPLEKNKESPQQATGYLNEGVYPLLSSVEQNKLLFVEFFVAFSTLGFDIFGDGLRIAMLAHRGDEVAT